MTVAADSSQGLTLEQVLRCPVPQPHLFSAEDIKTQEVFVTARDGTRLATTLYLPPSLPGPAVAIRTPYGRSHERAVKAMTRFARSGYVGIVQDCRGTGQSEPDSWDYYVYEREDSADLVSWVVEQSWFAGFLGGCGSSYLAQTQWCMSLHPRMSAIAPEVGGLGIAANSAHYYMFLNVFTRSVGKGSDKLAGAFDQLEAQMLDETLAGGMFNDPLHPRWPEPLIRQYPHLTSLSPAQRLSWLWSHYCGLQASGRAELMRLLTGEKAVTMNGLERAAKFFGHQVAHDAHMFATATPEELCKSLHAPALMITGWYDWGLNDALTTWATIKALAPEPVGSMSRLIITPSAHNVPGYQVAKDQNPELSRRFRTDDILDLLLHWYASVRETRLEDWPSVTYYMMGANEWRTDRQWPPLAAEPLRLYLAEDHKLTMAYPEAEGAYQYVYDPDDPTPTVGGSIVSYLYKPGSADVSEVQKRQDVLVFTTKALAEPLEIAGPLKVTLYASSSAPDTDFSVRLSDVFPDGRAIQLQSGLLRARNRNREPTLLQPNSIYELQIDLWPTANRFDVGHRLRLDIASADFPRFDRNSNLGGEPGWAQVAKQTIYHGPKHPSHLTIHVLNELTEVPGRLE